MTDLLASKPHTLTRTTLPDAFAAAVRQAEEAQGPAQEESAYRHSGRERPTWRQDDDGIRHLVLDDTVFIPDGEDGQVGQMPMLFSGIVVFVGIIFAIERWEPWMPLAAAIMIAGGGYVGTKAYRKQRRARHEPRRTGLYLRPEGLMQLSHIGTATFVPRRSVIEIFDHTPTSSTASHGVYVRYRGPDGEPYRTRLAERRAIALVQRWLAGQLVEERHI